jgi:hypothetical protein
MPTSSKLKRIRELAKASKWSSGKAHSFLFAKPSLASHIDKDVRAIKRHSRHNNRKKSNYNKSTHTTQQTYVDKPAIKGLTGQDIRRD